MKKSGNKSGFNAAIVVAIGGAAFAAGIWLRGMWLSDTPNDAPNAGSLKNKH